MREIQYKIEKQLKTTEAGFLFLQSTGDTFTLNQTAAEIIELLKENKSDKFIANFICNKYDIDKKSFEKDFQDLIRQLKSFSILE